MHKLECRSWNVEVGSGKPYSICPIPSADNWGLAVYYTQRACVQYDRLVNRFANELLGWVQTHLVIQILYHLCTQVLHYKNVFSVSVKEHFYPLSTQPIKTTTFKLKGI